jgi:hypothetical protein
MPRSREPDSFASDETADALLAAGQAADVGEYRHDVWHSIARPLLGNVSDGDAKDSRHDVLEPPQSVSGNLGSQQKETIYDD